MRKLILKELMSYLYTQKRKNYQNRQKDNSVQIFLIIIRIISLLGSYEEKHRLDSVMDNYYENGNKTVLGNCDTSSQS